MAASVDHITRVIVNANHGVVLAAAKLCGADWVSDCIRFAVQQATQWQHIGNQIDAAMIFARADFVNVHCLSGR
jgi:hypothetical protein